MLCVPTFQEVAKIAEWEDEQIEFIKEKVSEDGKKEDLKKGKAPAQVHRIPLLVANFCGQIASEWSSLLLGCSFFPGSTWWGSFLVGSSLYWRDVGW